jgi:hypothetical protein
MAYKKVLEPNHPVDHLLTVLCRENVLT